MPDAQNPNAGPSKGQEEVHAHWDTVRARLKYQLALESYEAGQVKPAANYVQESIHLNPNSGPAYVLLSRILLEQGETALAADVLEKASQCDSPLGDLAYQRGLIAERYGRFEEALHWYRQACQDNPLDATCIVAAAETLVSLGRMDEALTLCTGHWSDFEQNSTLRAVAGHIYTLLGRHEEAADAYLEASTLAPEDTLLATTLASALIKSQRYAEARVILDHVKAEGNTLSAASLVDLAQCNIALNNVEQGKQILTQAASASSPLSTDMVLAGSHRPGLSGSAHRSPSCEHGDATGTRQQGLRLASCLHLHTTERPSGRGSPAGEVLEKPS